MCARERVKETESECVYVRARERVSEREREREREREKERERERGSWTGVEFPRQKNLHLSKDFCEKKIEAGRFRGQAPTRAASSKSLTASTPPGGRVVGGVSNCKTTFFFRSQTVLHI